MIFDHLNLRDYLAAQALIPLLAAMHNPPDEKWRVFVALDAYKIADAMLIARLRTQKETP